MEKTIENKTGLKAEAFEKETPQGKTGLYVLRNSKGMEVCVTNYGAIILSMMVPDRDGKFENVVIGADSLEGAEYLSKGWYIGATIGPVAGRILGGRIRVGGKDYELALNSAPNTLHSGDHGFHTVVWKVESADSRHITMTYHYKDREAGFPGNIDVCLTYTLTEDNELRIDYDATTDAPAIFCPTNHAYFNLNGVSTPTSSIENHIVTLDADYYLPTDDNTNHTGEILRVEGTPFDFREPHAIGERIECGFPQLIYGKGYDHGFVLRKRQLKEMTHAATVVSPETGRRLDVETTEIGLIMYSGNYLPGFTGMHGTTYPRRSAICFETECFPDTPNNLHFPSIELHPEKPYHQTCVYRFSLAD